MTAAARKLAAVTGASTGIGAEYARQLARRGFDLVLVARRTDELERLGDDLSATFGVTAEPVTADLADPEGLQRVERLLADRAEAGDGTVDILVNNAGVGGGGAFSKQRPQDAERQLDLNVRAVLRLTRAVLPGQIAARERRGGPIGVINVSSLTAVLPAVPGNSVYAASKAFVLSWGESVAMEVRRRGITVTTVLPGYVRTEMTRGLQERGMPSIAWVDRERVVVGSLRAFAAGRTRAVPGWQYQLAGGLVAALPASAARTVVDRIMRQLG